MTPLHAFTMFASARGLCLARRLYTSYNNIRFRRYSQLTCLQPGMSNIYREISRKQYIASFGNIASEAIFRKYRDILMIFVMYDYGHFWPEIDPKIITTH